MAEKSQNSEHTPLFKSVGTLALALVVVCSTSCGGLHCPDSVPNCCYDALFGCGTFDLPFGCECSDYGLGFAKAAQAVHKALPATPAGRLSGEWSGVLDQTYSSCPGAPEQISGQFKLRQRNAAVTVNLGRYGKLRGKAPKSTRFSAQGAYADSLSGCEARVRTNFKATQIAGGVLHSDVHLDCGKALQCVVGYAGAIAKQ